MRVLAGVLIGLVAGFASGVAGVGGGTVMVPAMVVLLSTAQHTAEGTSLLAILGTSLAGSVVNWRNHHILFKEAAILGVAGAASAPLGAWLALSIDGKTLSRLFGIFLLLNGVRMIWKERRRKAGEEDLVVGD